MRAKMCLYVRCENSILYKFYIVSKRKHNDQFSLKVLKKKFSVKKKMHVREIYVIFIHLFDSGILLIIDLNKKKGGKKRGG